MKKIITFLLLIFIANLNINLCYAQIKCEGDDSCTGKFCGQCLKQSPLDFTTPEAKAATSPAPNTFRFTVTDWTKVPVKTAYDKVGHNMVATVTSPTYNFTYGTTLYTLKSIHMHIDNEHVIDKKGQTHDFEIHAIFNDGSNTNTVIGIADDFDGRGAISNYESRTISQLIQGAMKEKNYPGRDSSVTGTIDMSSIIKSYKPAGSKSITTNFYFNYFQYPGSLTTCKYTENVNWIVATSPGHAPVSYKVPPSLVRYFHKARCVQKLNPKDRKIGLVKNL